MSDTTQDTGTDATADIWDSLTLPEPAATDAVTETTPTVDETAETETEGQLRDPDTGKFAKADDGEAVEEGEATEGEEEQQPEGEADAAPVPFVFKLDGDEIEVPGSTVDKDGNVVVTGAENIELLSKYLGRGQKLDAYRERVQQREEQQRREYMEREAAWQVQQAQYQPIQSRFDKLLTVLEGATDPDKAVSAVNAWVSDIIAELPTLSGEMKLARERAEFEARQRATLPPPEVIQQQEQQQQVETLGQELADLRRQPWAASLNASDWRELADTVFMAREAFFVPAPFDDPMSGIVKGEVVLHRGKVQALAERRASQRLAARQAQSTTAAVTASKKTQQATAKVGTPAPGHGKTPAARSAPSGTKPASAKGNVATGRITSIQDFIDW